MNINDAKKMMEQFIGLGAKACTMTGGGDPLAYRDLPEFIKFISDRKVDSALVTNGVLFKNFDLDIIPLLTWARISVSDSRTFNKMEIKDAVQEKTDWSFSYVLSESRPYIVNIINVIDFANEQNFTHVRIVDDILDTSGENRIDLLKDILNKSKVDTSKVIWQGRKDSAVGHKRCFMGLLKPNISPDGLVAVCCGVQYASTPPILDFTRLYSIGTIKDIEQIYEEQRIFDGSLCSRCFYSDYNNFLNAAWDSNSLQHKSFV